LLIQICIFSTNLISVTFTYEPNNQFYYEQKIYSVTPDPYSLWPVCRFWRHGKE
jgi:hypothetical protein